MSKGLTFIISDKCNITCDFCGPDCGTDHKVALDAEFMIKTFEKQNSTLGVTNVVFTGGEPTLFLNDLYKTMGHINTCNIPMRIVTNAFWGRNRKTAQKIVKNLKDCGLTEFNFSVDDFHQEYISYQSIKTAVEVSKEFNIPVLLAHKTYPNGRSNKKTFENLLGKTIPNLESLETDEFEIAFSSANTIPMGRGAEKITDYSEWSNNLDSSWRGPCKSVFKDITVQPNRQLSPCCGIIDRKTSEFYFSDLENTNFLEVVENANSSVLYNWLALEGPSGIMDFIKENSSHHDFRDSYVQNCELCQQIFKDPKYKKIIAVGMEEKFNELLFKRRLIEEEFFE